MTKRELWEHYFKVLLSADFYPTQKEATAQLDQYLQSPEEEDIGTEDVLQVSHKIELKTEDGEYLQARIANIIDKTPEVGAKLNGVAVGWKTKRMGKVELTILRLVPFEIAHDDIIPERVPINGTVELAKKFSGNDSPALVSEILVRFIGKESKGQA